jgi:cytoskeletal protein CcmA (bactofilin family)
MDENKEENKEEPDQQESLESSSTASEPSGESSQSSDDSDSDALSSSTIDATNGRQSEPNEDSNSSKTKKPGFIKRILGKFNIYLVLMFLVLMIAVFIVIVMYLLSKHSTGASTISSQSLSQSTLQQLSEGNATVGSSNQILNVQSSTIFSSKVLMKQDLEIAGNLEIGNALTLNDIDVAGTAQVGQLSVGKDIAVSGNADVQGSVNIGKTLQVSGGGTFSGSLSAPQLTTSSLQLNGDLTITHHVDTTGGTPNRSEGPALGSGGTASLSGDDTSGSVNISTGGSPPAGCFISITFTSPFSSTPQVLITPVGASAGGLAYYVTRNTTGFSICDATAPSASSSFGFDYWVID